MCTYFCTIVCVCVWKPTSTILRCLLETGSEGWMKFLVGVCSGVDIDRALLCTRSNPRYIHVPRCGTQTLAIPVDITSSVQQKQKA